MTETDVFLLHQIRKVLLAAFDGLAIPFEGCGAVYRPRVVLAADRDEVVDLVERIDDWLLREATPAPELAAVMERLRSGPDLHLIEDLKLGWGRSCQVCGCRDEDCSGCIERTGSRCWWIEDDLCSACEDLQSRVEAYGYRRVVYRAPSWSRPDRSESLAGLGDDGRWWWAPESWPWGDVVRHAARFDTEAEALFQALAWLDAGSPDLVPPRSAS